MEDIIKVVEYTASCPSIEFTKSFKYSILNNCGRCIGVGIDSYQEKEEHGLIVVTVLTEESNFEICKGHFIWRNPYEMAAIKCPKLDNHNPEEGNIMPLDHPSINPLIQRILMEEL